MKKKYALLGVVAASVACMHRDTLANQGAYQDNYSDYDQATGQCQVAANLSGAGQGLGKAASTTGQAKADPKSGGTMTESGVMCPHSVGMPMAGSPMPSDERAKDLGPKEGSSALARAARSMR